MNSANRKYFVHESSDVQAKNIGDKTTIWQYCVVLPECRIGTNVNICSHCFIENNVIIGDNCTVKNGVHIFDGVIIEDNVFIGPSVCFTNDKKPRSKAYKSIMLNTTIKTGASIGAGAIILPGVTVGEHSLVGAGSVVTKDVPPFSVVYGNPARVV